MMTMVMMICCYPILWLMIAIFAWAAKRRGSIVLGMKLPEDCADDMEVNALSQSVVVIRDPAYFSVIADLLDPL